MEFYKWKTTIITIIIKNLIQEATVNKIQFKLHRQMILNKRAILIKINKKLKKINRQQITKIQRKEAV